MKLRPEFEVVHVALLNWHPLPSLDVCVGELLREEQCFLTQAALSRDSSVSKAIVVAYIAQDEGKGRDA